MFQIKRVYAILFIILVVLSVYYSALFAEVLSIDDQAMIDNLLNNDSFSFKGVFLPGGGYYYRPLLISSFIIDKYIWGLQESFMHLENVLLHTLNACLVYLVAIRIAVSRQLESNTTPLYAALLFALHPLATEPVNWISGRTDLLAGAFLFAALLFLLKSFSGNSPASLFISSLLFFISPLSKETSIFWYPAALFLIYVADRDQDNAFPSHLTTSFKNYPLHYVALTTIPIGYFILRHFALKSYDSGIGLALKGVVNGESYDLFNKMRISLKVFGFYLKKLIVPLPLNFTILAVPNWYVTLGICGVLLSIYFLYKRNLLSALLLMMVCIISPALLVPLGKMALAPVAERYLYMPTGFFAITVSVWGAELMRRYRISRGTSTIACILILLLAGYAAWQRNLVWQTNLTFFQEAVRQNPDYIPVKNELARALQGAGRVDEAQRIYLSIRMPETEKYNIVTIMNRANVLAAQKDITGAIALLKRTDCPESNPFYANYLQTRMYLNGLLLEQTSGEKQAVTYIKRENIELMKKLHLRTGDPYCYYRIGQLCLTVGDNREAAEYFRLAAEKSPDKAFYKAPARKLYERLSR